MTAALRKLVPILCVCLLLAGLPGPGQAFHERPGMSVSDPTVVSEAERVYLNHDLLVFEGHAHSFSDAFPPYHLYDVRELIRDPSLRHFMAFDPGLMKGFDFTRDANLLTPAAAPTTVAASTTFAKAFAEIANPEVMGPRHVVYANDSSWLGHTVTDPTATQTIGGWRVVVWTWADLNGVLAEWTLEFSAGSLTKGEWVVRALSAGAARLEWKATGLKVGVTVSNTYAGTAHAIQAVLNGQTLLLPDKLAQLTFYHVNSRANYDGSTWEISYAGTPGVAVTTWAGHLLDAAASAYGNLTNSARCTSGTNPAQNWGFRSRDADCRLEIRILPSTILYCVGCQAPGNETILYVGEGAAPHIRGDLNWYNNASRYEDSKIARLIVDHLLLSALATPSPDRVADVLPPASNASFTRADGTIDVDHPLLRNVLDPALAELTGSLPDEVVIPTATGCDARYPRPAPSIGRIGEILAEIEELRPRNWRCTLDATNFTRPIVDFPNETVLQSTPLGATIEERAGPGTKIRSALGGGTGYCSGGFLLRERGGTRLFLATAGHCFLPVPDDTDPSWLNDSIRYATVPRNGSVYHAPGTAVEACTLNCSLGTTTDLVGLGDAECQNFANGNAFCARIWTGATYSTLGTVHYARFDGIGEDFALVLIDETWRDRGFLRATLPTWGGPTGRECDPVVHAAFPQLALLYGNAVAFGEQRVIKGRAGFFLGECWSRADPTSVTLAVLSAFKGDSGGPIVHGEPGGTTYLGGSGLAVISGIDSINLASSTFIGHHPLVAGTSLEKGFAMVKEDLGLDLDLVCETEAYAAC